jgi:hypothetical protein
LADKKFGMAIIAPFAFPLRKAVNPDMIAFSAITPSYFAFATIAAAPQKKLAFQASSPKTYTAVLRGGFFLSFCVPVLP